MSTRTSKILSNRQAGFLKGICFFFIPVIVVFCVVEYLVIQIPQRYSYKSEYLNTYGSDIEILALGSSQMQNALNPEFLDQPALNLGSTSQHHRLDFEILKQTKDRLPNLKTVVLELSSNHLQLPHHSKHFWKNNIYLKYFNVNNFERKTYFKDTFLFISRPDVFQDLLIDHYITKIDTTKYNEYGYPYNLIQGPFATLDYNEQKIKETQTMDLGVYTNPDLAAYNLSYFKQILDYCEEHHLNVVIATIPMHTTFFKSRNDILHKKRDSMMLDAIERYDAVSVFDKEADTTVFKTRLFLNTNHLNANGGETFSKLLNDYLKTIPEQNE